MVKFIVVRKAVLEAGNLIPFTVDRPKSFAFAGPDQFKYDTSIDIFTAYKYYIRSKPWVSSNYLRTLQENQVGYEQSMENMGKGTW